MTISNLTHRACGTARGRSSGRHHTCRYKRVDRGGDRRTDCHRRQAVNEDLRHHTDTVQVYFRYLSCRCFTLKL